MSKKNKGTKNNNDAVGATNVQTGPRMDDNSKKNQGGAQNNTRNCNHKEGK